jgi:predicted RNA-binding protein YlqC (UPF0109 family)
MPDPRDFPVYQLLFAMVTAIVNHPHTVKIKTAWTGDGATFTVTVHAEDIGILIGKQDENANSIRTIVGTAGVKVGRKFIVVFEEETVAT